MNEKQLLALSKYIGGLYLLNASIKYSKNWDTADLILEAILKLQKAYRCQK